MVENAPFTCLHITVIAHAEVGLYLPCFVVKKIRAYNFALFAFMVQFQSKLDFLYLYHFAEQKAHRKWGTWLFLWYKKEMRSNEE